MPRVAEVHRGSDIQVGGLVSEGAGNNDQDGRLATITSVRASCKTIRRGGGAQFVKLGLSRGTPSRLEAKTEVEMEEGHGGWKGIERARSATEKISGGKRREIIIHQNRTVKSGRWGRTSEMTESVAVVMQVFEC